MMERRSVPEGWNRNTHYHDRLLAALPVDCRRVLDVGCGLGTFARRLARGAEHVDALDRDRDALAQAERLSRDLPNVRFVEADFLTWQPDGPYDAVSMIAVLHHLPFRAALMKAAALLRPGGVLLVLGLDRSPSLRHYVTTGAVAILMSGWYRVIHYSAPVGAPIAEPQMTLREIGDECASLLPGVVIRRHALLRYSLIWTKP
jgi:2-polyprenyl-3-methyl-5-hydroxy-6-metoxy-1,4-benzoquinol methylase